MKSYLLLILTLFVATGSLLAQEKEKKEKKKIIIIEKTIDEDGNETTTKTIKEGDAINDFEWHEKGSKEGKVKIIKKGDGKMIKIFVDEDGSEEELHEMHKKMKQEVNVNVEEDDGVKKISIKIKGEDGKVETIDWQGDGEFPAELKKELLKKGIHIETLEHGEDDVRVFIHSDDEDENSNKKMIIEVEENEEEGNNLLLDNININIASSSAGKKIDLTFKGKAVPTSISLIDKTGKQVYHSYRKDFKGMFDEQITVESAMNDTLELHIKQDNKVFVRELK